MLPGPAKWVRLLRRPLPRLDGVGEGAEALYLDGYLVAGLHPELRVARHPDAGRRTGDDDVAWLEGHAPAQERDQLGHGEDHLSCSPVLDRLPVEDGPDVQVLRVGDLVPG